MYCGDINLIIQSYCWGFFFKVNGWFWRPLTLQNMFFLLHPVWHYWLICVQSLSREKVLVWRGSCLCSMKQTQAWIWLILNAKDNCCLIYIYCCCPRASSQTRWTVWDIVADIVVAFKTMVSATARSKLTNSINKRCLHKRRWWAGRKACRL